MHIHFIVPDTLLTRDGQVRLRRPSYKLSEPQLDWVNQQLRTVVENRHDEMLS